jgi:cytoskeletal protein CcmA (bactofilin family)
MDSTDQILEIHSGISLKGQLSMVRDVILTGRFEGDLQTLGCLTVTSGGAVIGTIEASSLVLEPGNLVEARVKVAIPAKIKAAPVSARKNAASAKWPLSLKKLKDLALGRT